MRPVTQDQLKVIKSSVGSDITERYTGKRLVVAHKANNIMMDVLSQPPIGWNVGTTRAEYYIACQQAVTDQYYIENPPGFLGGIFLLPMINAVMSWLIRRWLDHLFPKEN